MGGRLESERQALLSRFTLDRIVMGATIANAPAGEQPSNPAANDHVPQSSSVLRFNELEMRTLRLINSTS